MLHRLSEENNILRVELLNIEDMFGKHIMAMVFREFQEKLFLGKEIDLIG